MKKGLVQKMKKAYLSLVAVSFLLILLSACSPPENKVTFDRITGNLVAVENGASLIVQSVPDGANVYLDETLLADKTPLEISGLAEGKHSLRIEKTNHFDYKKTLYLNAGQQTTIKAELTSRKGSLFITSVPNAADIYLDGKYQGRTPLKLTSMPTGPYQLKLSMDGYQDYMRTVEVIYNDVTTVEATLIKGTSGTNTGMDTGTDSSAKYIQVFSPKENGIWQLGRGYRIQWISNALAEGTLISVVLEPVYPACLDMDPPCSLAQLAPYTIASNIADSNYYDWYIPEDLKALYLGSGKIIIIAREPSGNQLTGTSSRFNVVASLADLNKSMTYCDDSDGGLSYYERGTVSGALGGKPFKISDSCSKSNANALQEYTCLQNGAYNMQLFNCAKGCGDGKCLGESTAGGSIAAYSILPLDFFGQPVGTKKTVPLKFNLDTAVEPYITLAAFDLDAKAEAKMYVNGNLIPLPANIFSDQNTIKGTVPIPKSVLKHGVNEVTFEFASNLDGTTTGFRIYKIVLGAKAFDRIPFDFYGKPVGTQMSTSFEYNADETLEPTLTLSAYDLDSAAEARVYVNGYEMSLPSAIYSNEKTMTAEIPISATHLKDGLNDLTIEYSSDLGGSTYGFRITQASIDTEIRKTTNTLPLNFFGTTVGTVKSYITYLDPSAISQPAILITAYDIDSLNEARLKINGYALNLPGSIVGDMQTKTAVIPLSRQMLRDGRNFISFEYVSSLGGTTSGYRIDNIEIGELDTLGTANPPRIMISSPTTGETFTTSAVAVIGTATDDNGLSKVDVKVNNAVKKTIQLSGKTASWSTTVSLAEGSNTIESQATDIYSASSDTAAVTIQYAPYTQCAVPSCNPDSAEHYCLDNQWVKCPEGQTCLGGICAVHPVCEAGACNPINRQQYCLNGQWASCTTNQICDAGRCTMPPAAECSSPSCNPSNKSEYCANGQWTACSSGFVCDGGLCVKPSVCNANTCNPANRQQYCLNGQWASCSSSQICAEGKCVTPAVCESGDCNPTTTNLYCLNGQWASCPSGQTCQSGNCAVIPTETKELVVYSDALNSPWYSAPWGASIEYSSTETVFSDSYSIKSSLGPWGALRIRNGPWGLGQDILPAQYKNFEFMIHGGTTGGKINVRMENDDGLAFPSSQRTIAANTWNTISIPLSELNPNNYGITSFYVQEFNGATRIFFIDNIKFTGESGPVVEDQIAPSVSIASPTSGATVSGIATISASASDNKAVTKVEFYRGTTLLGADASSPYSYSWNTAGLSGTQILVSKAYDAAGNVGTSSPVSISVISVPPQTCNAPSCNPANSSQYCLNGQWSACASGQICQNGACKTPTACTGLTCNPANPNEYCQNGQWTSCTAGKICQAGSCITPPIVNLSGFVTVSGTNFMLNGKPFYFGGNNAYFLMQAKALGYQNAVLQQLDRSNEIGIRVIRTWAFADGPADPGSVTLQSSAGIYDENTFKALDYVIAEAGKRNIKLILPFVNANKEYGSIATYVGWAGKTGEKTLFYTDPDVRQLFKNHISVMLNRVNTYNGIKYKDDPAIMAWEIVNEARFVYADRTVLRDFYRDIAKYIKSIDSKHLVTTGEEGFDGSPYNSKYSTYSSLANWVMGGDEGSSFYLNTAIPEIDFGQLHMYPDDGWRMTHDDSINWIRDHAEVSAELNKPVILGEYGYKTDHTEYISWLDVVEQEDAYGGAFLWQYGATEVPGWWLSNNGMQIREGASDEYIIIDHNAIMNAKSGGVVPPCTNQCSTAGAKQCSGSGVQTCGNYDPDSCLEWSSTALCSANQMCSNGICNDIPPTDYNILYSLSADRASAKALNGATLSAGTNAYIFVLPETGITRISFYIDNTYVKDEGAAPWDFQGGDAALAIPWAVTGPSPRQIKAVITTSTGSIIEEASSFSVSNLPPADTTPPTVSITTPTMGSVVSGTVAISATASDNVGIAKVQFYRDTTLIAEDTASPYSIQWSTSGLSDGTYFLSAVAVDTSGNTASSSAVRVTKSTSVTDTTPPSVSLAYPANGQTVSGTVNLAATASDNVGVTRVEFYLGSTLLGTDTSSPYNFAWNTAGLSGSKTLSAKAFDAAGNSASSSAILVTVSSVPPPPNITNSSLWVTAYLPSWELNIPGTASNEGALTVDEIDWDAFTHLIFFATSINIDGTCCNVDTNPYGNWVDLRLRTIVQAAHAHGKPVLFSVGGAGKGGWDEVMPDPALRTKAINNLVAFMNKYQFDGIDLDPEGGTVSVWGPPLPLFAQELRNRLNQQYAYYDNTKRPIITAAMGFAGTYWGQSHQYIDQLNIMSYDLMGTWWGKMWHNNAAENVKNPDGSCSSVDYRVGKADCMNTVEKKINEYLGYGIPRNKLGGGIDFNGHYWQGGVNSAGTNGLLNPRETWSTVPTWLSVGKAGQTDCTIRNAVESRYFAIRKCYLDKYPQYIKYDQYNQAPYFSMDNSGTANDIFITFQDANTIKNGVRVIKKNNLGGMILWEIGGGYLGKNNFPAASYPNLQRDELLQAVKEAVAEN